MNPAERVPLAPHCTLGVGGAARYFVEARTEADVAAALDWARSRRIEVRVLGGGSNLVVADAGVDALVLKIGLRGLEIVAPAERAAHDAGAGDASSELVEVTAAAGEPWDDLVRLTVERGWAGLECLSGIPGLVGATPIQNVGAYGQEVASVVTTVRVLDRTSGAVLVLASADCAFAYRDSRFKSVEPGRFVVLAVTYSLKPDGAPAVRYAELERHLAGRGVRAPSVADVRESVLAIRRSKSMVLDPADPNCRSCGSFFVNPIVSRETCAHVEAVTGDAAMPRWSQPDGRVKLSAAWLIERAGFRRGQVEGAVGLSTRHALAVVAHDGASARDVTRFARRVRDAVAERFGIRLAPEPEFWGIALDG